MDDITSSVLMAMDMCHMVSWMTSLSLTSEALMTMVMCHMSSWMTSLSLTSEALMAMVMRWPWSSSNPSSSP